MKLFLLMMLSAASLLGRTAFGAEYRFTLQGRWADNPQYNPITPFNLPGGSFFLQVTATPHFSDGQPYPGLEDTGKPYRYLLNGSPVGTNGSNLDAGIARDLLYSVTPAFPPDTAGRDALFQIYFPPPDPASNPFGYAYATFTIHTFKPFIGPFDQILPGTYANDLSSVLPFDYLIEGENDDPYIDSETLTITPVPEVRTVWLLGSAGLALVGITLRRRTRLA